jgi:DNA-binding transcriptional MocR family regulator
MLEPLGIRPWTLPRGGYYRWCRLPRARDAAEVAKAALHDGVVLAPGNVFSVSLSAPDLMRFNVTQMNARVVEVLKRAI